MGLHANHNFAHAHRRRDLLETGYAARLRYRRTFLTVRRETDELQRGHFAVSGIHRLGERLVGFQVLHEGEVGKAIVTVLSNFAAEGRSCSIAASSQESLDPNNPRRIIPRMLWRQATVECGDKRLRIVTTKQEGYPDSLQLTEEIGCPNEIVGSCEK